MSLSVLRGCRTLSVFLFCFMASREAASQRRRLSPTLRRRMGWDGMGCPSHTIFLFYIRSVARGVDTYHSWCVCCDTPPAVSLRKKNGACLRPGNPIVEGMRGERMSVLLCTRTCGMRYLSYEIMSRPPPLRARAFVSKEAWF